MLPHFEPKKCVKGFLANLPQNGLDESPTRAHTGESGQDFEYEYCHGAGIHYNWHRYYDPSSGRYLSPDTVVEWSNGEYLRAIQYRPEEHHTYAYASNNPLGYFDPNGLWSLSVRLAAIWGGGFDITTGDGFADIKVSAGNGLAASFSFDPSDVASECGDPVKSGGFFLEASPPLPIPGLSLGLRGEVELKKNNNGDVLGDFEPDPDVGLGAGGGVLGGIFYQGRLHWPWR